MAEAPDDEYDGDGEDGEGGSEHDEEDDSEDEDYEEPKAGEERNMDWLCVTWPLIGVLVTIACVNADAEKALVALVVTRLVHGLHESLRGLWGTSYERGTRNRRGHVHFFIELRMDPERIRALRGWVRSKLGLNSRVLGRLKLKYKTDIQLLLEATQSSRWYMCYIMKDAGDPHALMYAGGEGFSPEEFAKWTAEYLQCAADVFKGKIVLDWFPWKTLHAYYNTHCFPLEMGQLDVTVDALRTGEYVLSPKLVGPGGHGPAARARWEAYWRIIRFKNPAEIRRRDVRVVLFGLRPPKERSGAVEDPAWSSGAESDELRPGQPRAPPQHNRPTWKPGKYSHQGMPAGFKTQPSQTCDFAHEQREADARAYLNKTPAGVKVPLWGHVSVNGRTYYQASEAAWVGGEDSNVNYDRDGDFIQRARRTMRDGRIVNADENADDGLLGTKVIGTPIEEEEGTTDEGAIGQRHETRWGTGQEQCEQPRQARTETPADSGNDTPDSTEQPRRRPTEHRPSDDEAWECAIPGCSELLWSRRPGCVVCSNDAIERYARVDICGQ